MRALKRNVANEPLGQRAGRPLCGGDGRLWGRPSGADGVTRAKGQRAGVVTCVFKEQRGVRVQDSKGRGTWTLWEGQWELSCLLSKVDIRAAVGTVVT